MSEDLREIARYVVGSIDRQTEMIDRLGDCINDQSATIADHSLATGIDWERVFSQTGGLVDTGSIRDSVDELRESVDQMTSVLEAFATAYATANHAEDVYASVRDRQQR